MGHLENKVHWRNDVAIDPVFDFLNRAEDNEHSAFMEIYKMRVIKTDKLVFAHGVMQGDVFFAMVPATLKHQQGEVSLLSKYTRWLKACVPVAGRRGRSADGAILPVNGISLICLSSLS